MLKIAIITSNELRHDYFRLNLCNSKDFSVEYSTLSSSFEDRTIYEDIFGFEEEGQNKIIEYSIFYEDVACDLTLNNFHFDLTPNSVHTWQVLYARGSRL